MSSSLWTEAAAARRGRPRARQPDVFLRHDATSGRMEEAARTLTSYGSPLAARTAASCRSAARSARGGLSRRLRARSTAVQASALGQRCADSGAMMCLNAWAHGRRVYRCCRRWKFGASRSSARGGGFSRGGRGQGGCDEWRQRYGRSGTRPQSRGPSRRPCGRSRRARVGRCGQWRGRRGGSLL